MWLVSFLALLYLLLSAADKVSEIISKHKKENTCQGKTQKLVFACAAYVIHMWKIQTQMWAKEL